MLTRKDICVNFTMRALPELMIWYVLTDERYNQLWTVAMSKVHVVILSGDSSVTQNVIASLTLFEEQTNSSFGVVWILTSGWEFAAEGFQPQWWVVKSFHALSFAVHTSDVPGFNHFLWALDPYRPQGDVFLPGWWEVAFNCEFLESGMSTEDDRRNCTGDENLETLPLSVFEPSMTSHSYIIYNAVYSVARALHAVYLLRPKRGGTQDAKKSLFLNMKPWQVKSSNYLWQAMERIQLVAMN